MVSGSFIEWRGRRFVSRPSPTESFEWVKRPGLIKASSTEVGQAEEGVVSEFEFFDSVS